MEIIEIIKKISEDNYLGLVIVFMIISQYFIIKNNTNNFNMVLKEMFNNNKEIKEIQKEMLSELREIKDDIKEIKNELKEKSKV
jgi:hypothetical protein